MKAILLKDYRINPRQVAEATWGTGGTHSIKTNRKRAYYYSCSAHGGYVIPESTLTTKEKELIKEYYSPEQIQLLIQHRIDGDYVIGVSLANIHRYVKRTKNFKYIPHLGTAEWIDHDVYLFEEDCDWAILEKLTDIRHNSSMETEKRQEIIDNTFKTWAKVKV